MRRLKHSVMLSHGSPVDRVKLRTSPLIRQRVDADSGRRYWTPHLTRPADTAWTRFSWKCVARMPGRDGSMNHVGSPKWAADDDIIVDQWKTPSSCAGRPSLSLEHRLTCT